MITEKNATCSYNDLLQTTQWKERRRQILKRDNYHCRNCGSSASLEVHHRQYHIIKRIGGFRKPWAYPDSNLVTLCARCHQAGHKKYSVPVFNV